MDKKTDPPKYLTIYVYRNKPYVIGFSNKCKRIMRTKHDNIIWDI